MIGDPVALTIRRNIERPSKSIMKAFAGMPTGFVTDAYNGKGCLDYAIKPLLPTMHFSGSAITAFCGPMDNLAAMAILDFAKKGDVIVGDRDGVVAIPLAEAAQVVERLELVKKKEAQAEAKVKKGIKLKFWDPDALGSRLHYID